MTVPRSRNCTGARGAASAKRDHSRGWCILPYDRTHLDWTPGRRQPARAANPRSRFVRHLQARQVQIQPALPRGAFLSPRARRTKPPRRKARAVGAPARRPHPHAEGALALQIQVGFIGNACTAKSPRSARQQPRAHPAANPRVGCGVQGRRLLRAAMWLSQIMTKAVGCTLLSIPFP